MSVKVISDDGGRETDGEERETGRTEAQLALHVLLTHSSCHAGGTYEPLYCKTGFLGISLRLRDLVGEGWVTVTVLTVKTETSRCDWSGCSSQGSCTLYIELAVTRPQSGTVIHGTT